MHFLLVSLFEEDVSNLGQSSKCYLEWESQGHWSRAFPLGSQPWTLQVLLMLRALSSHLLANQFTWGCVVIFTFLFLLFLFPYFQLFKSLYLSVYV